eukprot:3992511-Prymnesium_polylepis.2
MASRSNSSRNSTTVPERGSCISSFASPVAFAFDELMRVHLAVVASAADDQLLSQALRPEPFEAAARALAIEAIEHLGRPRVGVVAGCGGLRGGEVECSRAEHVRHHRRLEFEGAEGEQSGEGISTFPCHLGCWRVGRPISHTIGVNGSGSSRPLHLLRRVHDVLKELGQRTEHALVALEVGARLALAELLLGASDIPGSKDRERAPRAQPLQILVEGEMGRRGGGRAPWCQLFEGGEADLVERVPSAVQSVEGGSL